MKVTIAALSLAAALATASPIQVRQAQEPDTVYGVDPSKPFYLSAITTTGGNDDDDSTSYELQPKYLSAFPSVLGLQAVGGDSGSNLTRPQANYTLAGDHYGTQLRAWFPALCTSAGYCPAAPPNLAWGNQAPAANRALAFHPGADQPPFGGLALYGQYHGGDLEAGADNYLVGAADTDFAAAFAVCGWVDNPSVKVLAYRGSNSSCVPVTVRAVQVVAGQ